MKVWHAVTGQPLLTLRMATIPYTPAMSRTAAGHLLAIANAEGGSNHGVTLLGSRASGKPDTWRMRPAEPMGMAQRKPIPQRQEPPGPPLPVEPMQPPAPEPADPIGGGSATLPPAPPVLPDQPAVANP